MSINSYWRIGRLPTRINKNKINIFVIVIYKNEFKFIGFDFVNKIEETQYLRLLDSNNKSKLNYCLLCRIK